VGPAAFVGAGHWPVVLLECLGCRHSMDEPFCLVGSVRALVVVLYRKLSVFVHQCRQVAAHWNVFDCSAKYVFKWREMLKGVITGLILATFTL
jgi:hypothetical protein